MSIPENLKEKLQKLISANQQNLNDIKKVALDQAWKILQLAVVEIIQSIEIQYPLLAGKDKKALAMESLAQFYDGVFVVVNIPFVPLFVQPIIHKYVKMILMLLVSATIDAMVTAFRNAGIFKTVKPV